MLAALTIAVDDLEQMVSHWFFSVRLQCSIDFASKLANTFLVMDNKRIFILLVLVLNIFSVKAATYTWDGSSSNLWNTAANWDLNAVPTTGDALVFPSGASNVSTSNDIAGGTSFASITFGAGGASTYTLAGNAIVLSGGATAIAANNTSLTMTISLNITFSTAAPTIAVASGGTLTISGTIDNGGLLITHSCAGTSTISGVISGTGGLTKTGTGTLYLTVNNTMSGTKTWAAGTIEIYTTQGLGTGNITMIEPAVLRVLNNGSGNNGTITMVGTFTTNTDGGTIYVANNGSNTGNNVVFSGTPKMYYNTTFNITGANGYTVQLTGVTNNSGTAAASMTFNPTTASISFGTVVNTVTYHTLVLDGTCTGKP